MTTERWRQVEDIFHSALDRAPHDRAAFLDAACAGDGALRLQIEGLLESFDEAGDFIEKPIVEDSLSSKSRKSPPSESLIGHKVGNYEILSPLGAGGMGEVYLARDARLDRQIAIKLLPAQFTQYPDQVERFEREARAASALNHPNIITIHDIGRESAAHFIATEFVQGRTLREIIANGKIPLRESLEIAVQIAGALQAAHAAGIVHRDIKPENVMVRGDGLVKLLDFGLAKLVGEDRGLRIDKTLDFEPAVEGAHKSAIRNPQSAISEMTDPRMLMGTLAYLSPEQSRGEKVDHRTDIFSLGVVLYEMVTGTRPFSGETRSATLDAILNREPEPVATEHPGLEYVIKRSLAKDREARYQTAREMRAVMQRLAQESDSASAGGAAYQRRPMAMWRSRRARVAWAFAGMAVLIAIWFFPAGRNAERPPAPATPLSARSTRVTLHEREEQFPSLAPDGRSLVYASRAAGDWDIYWQDVGGENIRNLTEGCLEDDTQPAFSPDGKLIAFRSQRNGGGVFVMSATGESVRQLTPVGHFYHPAWSPDGREILCTREEVVDPADRTAGPRQLWTFTVDAGEGRLVTSDDAAQPQWSPHGRRIACWGNRQKTQRDIWTMPARGGEPVDVTNDEYLDWNPVWSPDGRYLYFLSDREGGMNLFRVAIDEESGKASGAIERVTTPEGYVIRHLSFARNGDLAYAALVWRKTLHRVAFDPVRGALAGKPRQLTADSSLVDSLDISPDGQWIACRIAQGGRENILLVKSDGSGEQRLLTNDAYKDRGPRWSPDGRRIAFYSNRSGTWEIWIINKDGGDKRRLTFTEGANVYYPLWSPDGARIVYTRHGGVPFVIEVDRPLHERRPQPLLSLDEPEMSFWSRDWSADGQKLAGAWRSNLNDEPVVGLYSFPLRRFEPLAISGSALAWLNDNRRLLFRQDKKVFLADSRTQKYREALNPSPHRILHAVLSRDNRWLYYSLEQTESDIWMLSLK
jgi:eukaryotic-like serine/threonine-protein kinase